MAEVVLNPLDPGDALNAASVNNLMDGVKNAVNDIEADALAPGALNSAHLPSLLKTSATQATGGPGASIHTYSATSPRTWGPITQGGTALEIDFGSDQTFNADLGGIFVLADIFISRLYLAVGNDWQNGAYFRLEASTTAGAWVPLLRTERWMSSETQAGTAAAARDQLHHVPIRTLITVADLAAVRKVRAVVSVGGTQGQADLVTMRADLRECTLAGIVLQCTKE